CENWPRLQRLTARSEISLSRPIGARERGDDNRSVRMKHGHRPEREITTRLVGNRYTLKTDISMFYPSIYTHAVDWAVRGKLAAKRDRNGPHIGAKLDKALRNSRHGQTVGLSVGPD